MAERPASSAIISSRVSFASAGSQRLLQVGEQVINMFDAHRQTNQVFAHAGLAHFLCAQLSMRG